MKLLRIGLSILPIFICMNVHATGKLNVPGFIPLLNNSEFSSDLKLNGQYIGEKDYYELQREMDLSRINPTSNKWSNTTKSLSEIKLNESASEFVYSDSIQSGRGEHWFNVVANNNQSYEILLSHKSHNLLLRSALLTLLGYDVPKIKWLKRVTLNFSSEHELESFLGHMKRQTLQAEVDDLKKLWVVKINTRQLILRDVVITEPANGELNLATGSMHYTKSKDLRALNALLVPYTLTDVPSSINALNWAMGSVIENNYVLEYYKAKHFNTTKDDLYWIANKIADLRRSDFEKIVNFAKYPVPVHKVLVEKLISRKNSLIKDLGIKKTLEQVNYEVTSRPILDSGKLLEDEIEKRRNQTPWQNYAGNFVYGDFENPINFSRAFNYFKAEGISTGLTTLLDTFHNDFPIGTNISNELSAKYEGAIFSHLMNFIETGEYQEFNVGTVTIPYAGLNLHGSRDVIVGGKSEENISLMLSQSFGYSLGAGVFGITDSLPSEMNLRGKVEARVQRLFTNVRPLADVNQLNEQPLIDILVNWHMSSLSKELDTHVNNESIEDTRAFVQSLKENINIGESLVITDSLNFSAMTNLVAPINPTVVIGNSLFKNSAIMRRTNIVRSGEDTLQIYRGISDLNTFSLGFEAYAKSIPFLSLSWADMEGEMDTDIYEINIKNASAEELLAFLSFFKENDTRYLRENFKKGSIKHSFQVDTTNLAFFFSRYSKSRGEDLIKFTSSHGFKANILRKFTQSTSGYNLSFFVSSLFNLLYEDRSYNSYHLEGLLSKIVNKFGKDDKKVRIEYQDYDEQSEDFFWTENGFLQVNYNWNGFRDSSADIVEKMLDVNAELKDSRNFFPIEKMKNTSSVLYYNMNVYLNIYKNGFKNLIGLGEQQFANIVT
ncbi:MAG: hypothetical protein KC478_14340 [Bacteriovoracaceae bacterium]|nr:hypothetical protein [Bacteriovoracaceae bacterium]